MNTLLSSSLRVRRVGALANNGKWAPTRPRRKDRGRGSESEEDGWPGDTSPAPNGTTRSPSPPTRAEKELGRALD